MYARNPGTAKPNQMQRATAVNQAIAQKRQAAKKTAGRQDLSGAVGSTIQGKNGGTQQLGQAAQRRLAVPQGPGRGVMPPPSAPAPPPAGDPWASKTTGQMGPDPVSDAARAAAGGAMARSVPLGEAAPDMPQMPGQMPGMPPKPGPMGAQLEQAVQRRGMPMGGGDPAGGRGFVPPGMEPNMEQAVNNRPGVLPGGPGAMPIDAMGGGGAGMPGMPPGRAQGQPPGMPPFGQIPPDQLRAMIAKQQGMGQEDPRMAMMAQGPERYFQAPAGGRPPVQGRPGY
jgi:hypothetical protein